MAGMLPSPSFKGIVDYLALAAGIMLGFAILSAPMRSVESSFRKNGGA
tara:strand:+ start:2473 stop:2616 length:144 start_codon:yes stop_codon:yes gene_type:complete